MTLRVTLPVCPVCKQIGKLPLSRGTRFYCTGAAGHDHKRTKMEPVLFIAGPVYIEQEPDAAA